MTALTVAIERASDHIARYDRAAFRYRGADLTAAIERAAFIRLVNHEPLRAAFEQARPGGLAAPPHEPDLAFDDLAGRLLLERSVPAPAGLLRRLDRRGRRLLLTAA